MTPDQIIFGFSLLFIHGVTMQLWKVLRTGSTESLSYNLTVSNTVGLLGVGITLLFVPLPWSATIHILQGTMWGIITFIKWGNG